MSEPNDPSAQTGPRGSVPSVPAGGGPGRPPAAASEEAEAPQHRVAFDGANSDLWPLSLSIALYNLVTLFFYRFWGRTRVRQYLWGRTSFLGDRFAYTGTGREMFIGFLIVFFLIIGPLAALTAYVFINWGTDLVVWPAYVYAVGSVSYFLFYVASYRALRYRLSRTNWRGIRGTQRGSSFKYGLKAMGWLALAGLSMGLTYPLQRVSLTGLKVNNAWFGDRKFSFSSAGQMSSLYGPFMRAWAGYIFKPTLIVMLTSFAFSAILALVPSAARTIDPDKITAATIAIGALVALGWMRTYARYKSREITIMAPWARFGNLTFRFEVHHSKMFRLIFGNLLLTFLTLGFARPIAQKRKLRFIAEHLNVLGEPDLDTLRQSTDAGPGLGEGLADAFDAGSI